MLDCLIVEVMLAIFNKEHTAPIASAHPYDARSRPWWKRPRVVVTATEYGAYGLRMFIWQAHGAQSRIRGWRAIGDGEWNPDFYKGLAGNMRQDILSNFLANRDYACLSSGVNGQDLLRFATQTASQPLTPSDCTSRLTLAKKKKKWRFFMWF